MRLRFPATGSALTVRQPSIRRFAQWSAMQEAFQKEESNSKESEDKPSTVPSKPPAQSQSVEKNSFQGATLNDNPLGLTEGEGALNWSSSFHGLGTQSFGKEIQEILGQPIASDDIEITPDGLIYLPEIKYRRILNRSFGAGGWGLAPRSQTMIAKNGFQGGAGTLTREYALIANGRLVSIARGEQDFFSEKGIPTATEGCKSNALMRCCKDLGIASELWDPKFIREFKKKYTDNVFVEHVPTKKKKKIWKRKDGFVDYPFKL